MNTPIAAGARHDAAVGAGHAQRRRSSTQARSTSRGARRPTTSASPAIRSTAARAPAAPTTRSSRPRPGPRRPTRTPRRREQQLRLRGPRGRRRRQPRARSRTRCSATTPATPDTTPPSAPGTLTGTVVGVRRDRPHLGRCDRQRRRHRLPGVPVPRRRLHQLRALDAAGRNSDDVPRHVGRRGSTTYGYEVRAVDAAGNLGPFSNTVSATTPGAPDTTPPSAPGTLTSNAVSAGEIDLSWGAATDNVGVTSYDIFRCTGPCVRHVREGRADGRRNDELQRHGPHGGDELQLRGSAQSTARATSGPSRTSRRL